MPDFTLHNQSESGPVIIPARFIDQYMTPAAGEYVKIYLLLLRCLTGGIACSVGSLADRLQHTEGDILRALHYWEDQGLLRLQFDSRQELTDVCLLPLEDSSADRGQALSRQLNQGSSPSLQESVTTAVDSSTDQQAAALSPVELMNLTQDDAFQEFLMVAQRYLGRTLKPSDCDHFAYWYQLFHCSADLLNYLVEYCVENGHTSLHYMEKVVLNWHQNGITTISAAKDFTASRSKVVHAVMSAFGLKDRAPGDKEQELIHKWYVSYGFSTEMIRLACNRTISAIHKPSFAYADSILSSWKEQGITTPEAAAAQDARRRSKKTASADSANNGDRSGSNRFHNFGQRQYDYEALEDQLYNCQH